MRLWLARQAYALGVISGFWTSGLQGGGWRVHNFGWRGKRPYVLFIDRRGWSAIPHFLRYRHWIGENVGLGICGKCAPWPCCGATGWDHLPGCKEEF